MKSKRILSLILFILILPCIFLLQACNQDDGQFRPPVRPDGYVDLRAKLSDVYEVIIETNDDDSDIINATQDTENRKYYVKKDTEVFLIVWAKSGNSSGAYREFYDAEGNLSNLKHWKCGDKTVEPSYTKSNELTGAHHQSHAKIVVTEDISVEPIFEKISLVGMGIDIVTDMTVDFNALFESNGDDFWKSVAYAYYNELLNNKIEIIQSADMQARLKLFESTQQNTYSLELDYIIKLNNYSVEENYIYIFEIYLGESGKLYIRKSYESYTLSSLEIGLSLNLTLTSNSGTIRKITCAIRSNNANQ